MATGIIDVCDMLKKADEAYARLMTIGAVRVAVDQNGQRVEYSTANADKLLMYMETLQCQCHSYKAVALRVRVSGPTRYYF